MGNNGKHGKQWEAIIAYVAENQGTKSLGSLATT
jgi:hypothetical protein